MSAGDREEASAVEGHKHGGAFMQRHSRPQWDPSGKCRQRERQYRPYGQGQILHARPTVLSFYWVNPKQTWPGWDFSSRPEDIPDAQIAQV